MGRKTDEINAIFEQNRLLREQNELLRKNIDILQQSQKSLPENSPANSQVFVKNIDKDEMRSGFLVTTHRKRLWNAQICLINEFARICKKHNLRWYAAGGTLLGAARHKGFIPWDDDVDVVMLRPDYEKFNAIAPSEIKPPYYFDAWYNYRLEGEPQSDSEEGLPLITLEQQKKYFIGHFPSFPIIKIRDSRTSMIEFNNRKNVHQGIWLDIFPLDPIPPFADKKQQVNFNASREMLLATFAADQIKKSMQGEHKFTISDESMQQFLKLSYKRRARSLDNFLLKNFGSPDNVGDLRRYCYNNMYKFFYDMNDMKEITYLPFEEIELPAPVGYDHLLTSQYGDWHKMLIERGHVADYSTDIPFREYYKTSAFMK